MFCKIFKILSFTTLLFASGALSQTKGDLIAELKEECQKLDNSHNSSDYLAKSINRDIYDIKKRIHEVKKELRQFSADFDNAVYFDNDVNLDESLYLSDFYVYEFSANSYQVFARLKNKQQK